MLAFQGTDSYIYMGISSNGTDWTGLSSNGTSATKITQLPTTVSGDAPSMVMFNKKLWMTYNSGHLLYITSSSNGTDWSPPKQITTTKSDAAPNMVVFYNQLWVAYVDTNSNVCIVSSSDGATWNAATNITKISSKISSSVTPTMVVLNNKLWMTYKYDKDQLMYITSSSNGTDWSTPTPNTTKSKAAPNMVVFNNQLWVAYVDTNSKVYIQSYSDGATTWNAATQIPNTSSSVAPSMVVLNNNLWMTYKYDKDQLMYTTSFDGKTTWSTPTPKLTTKSNAAPNLIGNFLLSIDSFDSPGFTGNIFGGHSGTDNVGTYAIGEYIGDYVSFPDGYVYFLKVNGLGSVSLTFNKNNVYCNGTSAGLSCSSGDKLSISVNDGKLKLSISKSSVEIPLTTSMMDSGPLLMLMGDMVNGSLTLQKSWSNSAINTICTMGFPDCLMTNLASQCKHSFTPDCCQQFIDVLQGINFSQPSLGRSDDLLVTSSPGACIVCTLGVTAVIAALSVLAYNAAAAAAAEAGVVLAAAAIVNAIIGSGWIIAGVDALAAVSARVTASQLAMAFANALATKGSDLLVVTASYYLCQEFGACPAEGTGG
jgi:hypothetical protein